VLPRRGTRMAQTMHLGAHGSSRVRAPALRSCGAAGLPVPRTPWTG
jgi:hypothetical protein